MKTLLVTGASGFVGGHTAVRASGRFRVVAAYGANPFHHPDIESVALNLMDEASIRTVFEKIHPDYLIHCAAWSSLDDCERDSRTAHAINVDAAIRLARLSAQSGCRMIFTSSDMVFDGNRGDYSEIDGPNPIQRYGRDKLEAEREIAFTLKNHVIARLALVYGKPLAGGRSFSQEIVDKLADGRTVSLFTDQYRTPILVQNAADGLIELAEHPFTGLIHFGGSERISRCDFGMKLAEAKGLPKQLIKPRLMDESPTVAQRPRDVSFDIALAREVLSTRFAGTDEGIAQA